VRSILFYVVLYFGVFLVLHTIGGFRRWWSGAIGALNAVILTFTPQLLERGIWPTLLAALLLVGLSLVIRRDQKMSRAR
jgi:hypothetical protein